MRKVWIWFMISPLMVGVLRLLVSLIFWVVSLFVLSDPLSSFAFVKSFLNRTLGVLGFFSLLLFLLWIIFVCVWKAKFALWELVEYWWKQTQKHMGKFVLWFGIYIVLQIISTLRGYSDNNTFSLVYPAVSVVVSLLIALLGGWLNLWFKNLSLHIVHDKKPRFSDVFVDLRQTGIYILSSILVGIFVVVWMCLLVLPGIIVSLRLKFVGYLILDKKLWPRQAIKASWKMTKWFASDIFALNLLCGLINILGVLAIFVGLLRTVPLLMLANAYLYKKMAQTKKATK